MSLEKLKATAYDILAQLNFYQEQLRLVNDAIAKATKEEQNAKIAGKENIEEAQALADKAVDIKPAQAQ